MTHPTIGGEPSAHTPGLWHVTLYDAGDKDEWSGTPSVQASDEIDCAIVHWAGFAQRYWRSARGDTEMHANARLIAAAPELLATLKALVAIHDDEFGTIAPEMDAARAAIRKATGATP